MTFQYSSNINEPEANEMAAFPARDRDAFMAHWTKILGDETLVAMTVVVDGCVAGNVGCWTQDGQRLVGYWIGKEHWLIALDNPWGDQILTPRA
jgi:hypothetical protein